MASISPPTVKTVGSHALNINEIKEDKYRRIMRAVAKKASYYRANPQRFVKEILNINLKLFQKILIWAMMHYNYFLFIAARGLGKTYLTAMFCVVRCVLYPGSKIVITSGSYKQAKEVLSKIQDEIMPKSAILRTMISECKIGQNEAIIRFRGGSWIRAVAPTDTGRGLRANLIVCDEYRQIEPNIISTVVKRFLASPRHPNYLNKPEYSHLKERNKEIYMSSAWFKDSWAYEKAQAYTVNFFDDTKKYFICGLPYELSIYSGLLMKEQVQDEMSEADFNEMKWQMEMECLWLGNDGDSFFKSTDLNNVRKVERVLYPLDFYDDKNPVPDPPLYGKRVLSLDIALMASSKKKKNDASALYINDLTPNGTAYQSSIVYGETFEGLTSDALGIIVMRYFYEYKCTDLVIDCNGNGISVYDYIIKDHYDNVTGKQYTALTCINAPDMASRCITPGATKAVWSVKANIRFNSQICTSLRDGIRSGKILLPKNELMVEDYLMKNCKGYKNMSPTEQMRVKTAYIQTTLAVFELIKLKAFHDNNGNITVKEQSGMRKDRYSSLAYNYWVACQLELQLKPKTTNTQSLIDKMVIRRGKFRGRYI